MRWLALFLCFMPFLAAAQDGPGRMCSEGRFGPMHCIRAAHFTYDVCQQIEAEALFNGLDPAFFARLLWQESRFDPNALSHADARGIAQFIDSTAALRGLRDSYNPAEAIEKSAEYLGEMVIRYGNQGLAAIGYNGGERRVEGLMAGTGGLARETVDYVRIITGLPAETWRDAPPEDHDMALAPGPFQPACRAMARNRRVTPLRPPDPPPGQFAPWGVQVSYGTSEANARTKVRRLPAACRGGKDMQYVGVKSRVTGRPGYIMARIGRPDRGAASRLCTQLRARGCACAVYRNPR